MLRTARCASDDRSYCESPSATWPTSPAVVLSRCVFFSTKQTGNKGRRPKASRRHRRNPQLAESTSSLRQATARCQKALTRRRGRFPAKAQRREVNLSELSFASLRLCGRVLQ